MDFARSKTSRLFLFGALYFAQGVPWGFISITLALYLTGEGLGSGAIGEVLALSYLPWTFKPLFGPVADKLDFGRHGQRRPWILAAELGMGATLLWLAGVDPKTHMTLFLGLIFAHNVFAAAQDVGVDAFAIEVLEEHERGTANSIMWASKYAGVVVGGAGLSQVGRLLGWKVLFLVMAAMIFAIALLPLFSREPPRQGGRTAIITGTLRSLAVPAALVGLVFIFVAEAGTGLLGPVFIPLLKDKLGYSDGEIGTISGLVSSGFAVAGSLAGGILSDRIGRRRALVIFASGAALCYLGFGLLEPAWSSRWLVYGYVSLSSLFEGMTQATILSLAMDLTNPALGGTQFTIYMAASNAKNSWTSYLGGKMGTAFATPAVFVLAALAHVASLPILRWARPAEAAEAFRKAEPAAVSP